MNVVKIITTDPNTLKWKSLKSKLTAIEGVLNTANNADFKIEIEYRNLTPKVVNGRIDRAWFKENVSLGLSDFFILHMNLKQKTKWGIKPTLRGSTFGDGDDVGDMYVWADETTKRGRFNQFVETILHEIMHELYFGMKLPDQVHALHDKFGTLRDQFKVLDISKYQPLRQAKKTLLRRILASIITALYPQISQDTTLHPRLPAPYTELISQDYGVKNPAYKLTGRHIGIDYACPVGTPVYAPYSGDITVVGNSGDLGNFCYFKYQFEGKTRVERSLHLKAIPEIGPYARGEIIAHSGDTGMSTGPHYHCDGWWDEVKIGQINKTNWNTLTYRL